MKRIIRLKCRGEITSIDGSYVTVVLFTPSGEVHGEMLRSKFPLRIWVGWIFEYDGTDPKNLKIRAYKKRTKGES